MALKLSENIASFDLALSSGQLARLKQAAEREIEIQTPLPLSPAFKSSRSPELSRWYMGSLMTFLADSKQTHGDFALVEALMKPGNEPPPHVHEREDEFFYVLEGKLDAYVGREVLSASAGECFYLPKGTPHGFVIGSQQLRVLVLITPGGFEEYFRAMSSPAEQLDFPAEAITYSQGTPEEAVRLAAKLGLHFLSAEEIAKHMPAFPRGADPTSVKATQAG